MMKFHKLGLLFLLFSIGQLLYSDPSVVSRIEDYRVVIRNGGESGFQPGLYFGVYDVNIFYDEENGENREQIREQAGVILIEQVDSSFVYGRIIEGFRKIREGMYLYEFPYYSEESLNIHGAYNPLYTPGGELIPGVMFEGNYSTSLNSGVFGGLGISFSHPTDLLVADLYIDLGYQTNLIPEVVQLYVKGKAGILLAGQNGRNVQDYLDEANLNAGSDNPTSVGLELGAQGGVEIPLTRHWRINIGGGYTLMTVLNTWKVMEDVEKDAEYWEIPAEYLNVPSYDGSGFYLTAGLVYRIR